MTLPFDIPLEGEAVSTQLESGVFDGTQEAHFPACPGQRPMPWPGLRPLTNIWIRRGPVVLADTILAESEAFPWLFPDNVDESGTVPPYAFHAVVLVTRIVAEPELGKEQSVDEQERAGQIWLSDEFDAALLKLNEWLVTLASISGEPAIGPVTTRELPPLVVFFTTDPLEDLAPGGPPPPEPSLLMIHPADQDAVGSIDPRVFDRMRDVQRLQHSVGHPFFPYAEAMVAARRNARLGRAAASVLEASTAIELLVSTVVREASILDGASSAEARQRASYPLRNRIEHHLGAVLGVQIALTRDVSAYGRWYRNAYAVRNRVVHEGYRPTMREAQTSLDLARELMISVGRALHATPQTETLGRLLVTFET